MERRGPDKGLEEDKRRKLKDFRSQQGEEKLGRRGKSDRL